MPDQWARRDRGGGVADLGVRDAEKKSFCVRWVGAAAEWADQLNPADLGNDMRVRTAEPAVADDGKTELAAGVLRESHRWWSILRQKVTASASECYSLGSTRCRPRLSAASC